jgi:hypothetical protein
VIEAAVLAPTDPPLDDRVLAPACRRQMLWKAPEHLCEQHVSVHADALAQGVVGHLAHHARERLRVEGDRHPGGGA